MPSLLNHEKISTQLRDWIQMAQQKSLKFAGSPESTSYFAESCRYVRLLEYIEQQAEEIRVIRANHAQMCKDFDARNELLEKEQQEHLLTKGTLMVREAELAEERRIYKAARPGKQMPKPFQLCEPEPLFWFGNAKLTGGPQLYRGASSEQSERG